MKVGAADWPTLFKGSARPYTFIHIYSCQQDTLYKQNEMLVQLLLLSDFPSLYVALCPEPTKDVKI